MANSDVRIEGLSDLRKALNELPKAIADQILSYGLRRAGKVIAETARRLAPEAAKPIVRKRKGRVTVTPVGFLKKSIVVRQVSKRQVGIGQTVKIRVGFGKGAMYGVPLEFGADPGKRGGERIEPHRFMTRAYEQHKNEVLEIVRDAMRKRLPQVVARLRKQGKLK